LVNIYTLIDLFTLPTLPKDYEATKKKIVRKVIARTANGNVLLQLGKYSTSEDINNLKKEVLEG
jgi:hypothetical protein